MTYLTSTKAERGSSLLGLSLFLVAFGFLTVGGIALYQNYDLVHADQKSIDYSKDIEEAIMAFVDREGRFPCPAPIDAPMDTPEFGREISGLTGTSCLSGALDFNSTNTYRLEGRAGMPVRLGTVPTRDLNLPDYKMFDGYGKRYYYAITEELASAGTNVNADFGAISIHNEHGEHISESDGFIVYALMSMGEDDRGAFNEDGVLLAPCNETTLAGTNCRILNMASAPAVFMTTMSKSYNIDDNFSHSFAYFANSVPYKWVVTPWSNCQGVCLEGTRTRSVSCQDVEGSVVTDNLCGHTPRPDSSGDCTLPPCEWNAGAYGTCVNGLGITADSYLVQLAQRQRALEAEEAKIRDAERRLNDAKRDLDDAENALDAAEDALDDAEDAFDNAGPSEKAATAQARNDARDAVKDAEDAVKDAEDAVKDAEKDLSKAKSDIKNI